MKIKCTIGDRSTVVTPQWLLDNCVEDLEQMIICSDCKGMEPIGETNEPSCYGECIESYIESCDDTCVKFELEE